MPSPKKKSPTGRLSDPGPNMQGVAPKTAEAAAIREAIVGPSIRDARGDKVPDIEQFETKLTDVAVKISEFADAAAAQLAKPEQTAVRLAYVYAAFRRTATALKYAIGYETDDKYREGSLLDTIRKMSEDIIPKAFEREQIISFNTDDGYRVGVGQRYLASIKGDRKEDAYQWLRDNGLPDIIIETVNASTLSSAGKALIEDKAMELPEELFNAAWKPTTSLTKTGKRPGYWRTSMGKKKD